MYLDLFVSIIGGWLSHFRRCFWRFPQNFGKVVGAYEWYFVSLRVQFE